ncbi:hypothetical protein [Selenihalanaerobacter shriftii]|uniref:DUF2914 domain-containing protein n=1 Tax=Selenihalanaerobacter shriftii TaxID=142842 RepID=A0A1T4NLN3_9FIRM|nr:hypothetical protein [Selenihalanaerobacter shriftii]SJZ80026.1 hypothetical protein SAMN02745118_01848 [Selenihalanaerobacter shriftii]
MVKNKKILVIIILCVLFTVNFISDSAVASESTSEIKLNSILVTNGLNDSGFPLEFKRIFNLNEDLAVQYYVSWHPDDRGHKIIVKWIDPSGRVVNQLKLFNFRNNTIKSYISLKEEVKTQLLIPDKTGQYSIKLYIDEKLIAVTNFKLER